MTYKDYSGENEHIMNHSREEILFSEAKPEESDRRSLEAKKMR